VNKAIVICALICLVGAPALAQVEEDVGVEEPGGGEGYAWGEGGARASDGEDPVRIQAWLGVGAGLRLLRNLDPPFQQDFLVPPYLDLGAAVFAPGTDIRHGGGLTLSMNLMQDVSNGVLPGEQWAITPSYHLMIPLRRVLSDMQHDLVQLQGRVGVPIVLGTALGSASGGVDVSVGLELGVSAIVKFLAGLGVYLEVQFAIYGGTNNTVHPILTFDGGLVFDYEVLP
jgi:hypothetical protein